MIPIPFFAIPVYYLLLFLLQNIIIPLFVLDPVMFLIATVGGLSVLAIYRWVK